MELQNLARVSSNVRKPQNFLKLYANLSACADLYVSKENLQSSHDIIMETVTHFNLKEAMCYPTLMDLN